MKRAALFFLAAALGACGLREPLEPPPGATMPAAPSSSRRAPTTEELLTPPPIARPDRVDELLRRSEEREEDRFDLPPADVGPGDDPVEPRGDDPD
jgi:predicted small lipoprotein YifL